MRARKRFTLPIARRLRPRWIALSVVAHAALVGAMVLSYGGWRPEVPRRTLSFLLERPPAVQERPLPPASEPPPPVQGPPRRPLEIPTTPDQPELAPTVAAPVDTAAPPGLPGGQRGARGVMAYRPGVPDPRIAVTPMYIPEGGGRPISMDSVVRQRLLVMADMMDSLAQLDSLSPNADRRVRNPSWVVERNGRRYGIDQRAVHFGVFSLPTALLALLPLPQGNVDQARANQRLLEMRAEILRAAARAEAEDDFDRAVREIRTRWIQEREERRERERRQRERERAIP